MFSRSDLYYAFPRLRELAFLLPPLLHFRLAAERAVLQHLDRWRGREGEALEVGCGTGRFSRKLAEALPRFRILAVDLSDAMIRQARKNPRPNLRFQRADFFRLTGPFDLVVGVHVLPVLPPDQTFEQTARLLRAGGEALWTTTAPGWFSRLHRRFFRTMTGRTIMLLPPKEALKRAQKAGFLGQAVPITALEPSYLLRLWKRVP